KFYPDVLDADLRRNLLGDPRLRAAAEQSRGFRRRRQDAAAGGLSVAKHEHPTAPKTTGHAWDGIEELNTPLPRWWVGLVYATIVWSFGYWIVYPAWPTISGYTTGLLGYSTRAQVAADLADLRKIRGEKGAALEETPLADIEKDPALLAFAQAQGRAAFANNCAPCHGAGATGAKGYPNLNDDDWLWGGSLTEIRDTI